MFDSCVKQITPVDSFKQKPFINFNNCRVKMRKGLENLESFPTYNLSLSAQAKGVLGNHLFLFCICFIKKAMISV